MWPVWTPRGPAASINLFVTFLCSAISLSLSSLTFPSFPQGLAACLPIRNPCKLEVTGTASFLCVASAFSLCLWTCNVSLCCCSWPTWIAFHVWVVFVIILCTGMIFSSGLYRSASVCRSWWNLVWRELMLVVELREDSWTVQMMWNLDPTPITREDFIQSFLNLMHWSCEIPVCHQEVVRGVRVIRVWCGLGLNISSGVASFFLSLSCSRATSGQSDSMRWWISCGNAGTVHMMQNLDPTPIVHEDF